MVFCTVEKFVHLSCHICINNHSRALKMLVNIMVTPLWQADLLNNLIIF